MIFNHICIRVEDLDATQRLLRDSFGLEGFLSPGGETFDEEKEFRVAWLVSCPVNSHHFSELTGQDTRRTHYVPGNFPV